MYPKNAASPEPIAIGAVVQISDGVVQTSGCTVRIKPIGVAEGDGAGTTAYSTDGIVLYTPTQGETNYTSFILIAKKTGCIPVSITVVTTESAVAGRVSVGMLAGVVQSLTDLKDFADDGYDPSTNKVQGVVLVDTLTTYTGNTPQTGDSFARLGAPSGASVSVDVAAVKAETAAILDDTDLIDDGTSGLAKIATDVAAILVDTGTTLQAELDGIQADTEDIQARLPAALTAGGNMKADALAISGDTTAATVLKKLMLGTPSSTVNDGAATSTSFVTALTETTNDHYAGAFILFTDGVLVGQSQKITAYNGTSKTITCDAFTEAPGNGDAFLILGKDPN